MNSNADKTLENKSIAVSSSASQVKSSGEATFHSKTTEFVDNRPEAVTQQKLQEIANNSPQTKPDPQLQEMTGNYFVQEQYPIQRKASIEPSRKENNTGLPDNLKTGMENLSGMSLDHVKVHRNSDKPAAVQAHAYAQGSNIHLASGQEKHLPHELGHVVQQAQGRVKPTTTVNGMAVNDNVGLESEADMMGAKALQGKFIGSKDNVQLKSQDKDRSYSNERQQPLNKLLTQRRINLYGVGPISNEIKRDSTLQLTKTLSPSQVTNTIQRFPKIGKEGEDGVEATTWAPIAAFLKVHGQHAFHGFSVDLESESGDNFVFSKIDGTFLGKEGAKSLSMQLLVFFNAGLLPGKVGNDQKMIMRKLAEIMELVRTCRNDLVEDRDRALEISKQLYHDSGLCLGFTEIYKRHAKWEMALWDSIAKWKPTGGSAIEELEKLNIHLEKTINWAPGDYTTNALEATLLLKEAWEYMSESNEDEYKDLTSAFAGDALIGSKPDIEPISLGQTTRLIKSLDDIDGLMRPLSGIIHSLKPTPPKMVIEISTAGHSMMASYEGGKLVFLEPQYWGAVECSWSDLAKMLHHTLTKLGNDYTTGFALDIDVHAQIPKTKQSSTKETGMSSTSIVMDSSLLKSLTKESLISFKGIEKDSDPASFLSEYNADMYALLFTD